MGLLQTFRIAVLALKRNAMRSFLTTLGIIIGVSAVIAMVAMGEGAKKMVENAFSSMGSNMLIIMPGTTTSGGAHGGHGSLPTITYDDMRAILAEVPTAKYASPALRATAQIISEDQNWTTSVNGVSPDFLDIRSWKVDKGEAFTSSDVENSMKVVLLGQTVVDKLYGSTFDPVGQTVRIKNIPFHVVGVLEKKGQSGFGMDMDDVALIPYSTFQSKISSGGMGQFIPGGLFIGATSAEATEKAEKMITELLRDRHRIPPGGDDDFSIRNMTEIAKASQSGAATLTTLLAGIAAVSLLVGGIGIMNIMLVSVTERTREIGLRMAVGAKPRNIMAQFLVEALTLSVAGGAIGVGIGIFAANKLAASFGWPLYMRGDIMILSVAFSALVGVVFGLYPARKASKLDPIEALRYE